MTINKEEIQARAAFIAKECGGIYPPHEVLYLQSILYAADRGQPAVGLVTYVRAALASRHEDAVQLRELGDGGYLKAELLRVGDEGKGPEPLDGGPKIIGREGSRGGD